MVGKARWQELEADDYTVSTGGKQRGMHLGLGLGLGLSLFSSYLDQDLSLWDGAVYIQYRSSFFS